MLGLLLLLFLVFAAIITAHVWTDKNRRRISEMNDDSGEDNWVDDEEWKGPVKDVYIDPEEVG